MELRHLVDEVLLHDTKTLVGHEREIMSHVLHHLREIERRKLYADLGHSSMFAYCTIDLKYSSDQAQRRICASRLLAVLPEIEKSLDDGSLNLTTLGMANNYFNQHHLLLEDQKNVLEIIANKSKRQVEKILARDTSHAPDSASLRCYSKTQTKVTLVLNDTVVARLKELQALFSHSKKRELPELIDFLCTQELERRKKSANKLPTIKVPNKNSAKIATASGPRIPALAASRKIPAAIKKQVWARAQGKCQYPKCSSQHFLQIHHRTPYALGGTHTAANLKLLCHAHHAREHR